MGMDIFKLFVFEAKIVTLLAHTGGGYENQKLNCLPELTFEILARCTCCLHHCLLPKKWTNSWQHFNHIATQFINALQKQKSSWLDIQLNLNILILHLYWHIQETTCHEESTCHSPLHSGLRFLEKTLRSESCNLI
jgi:hypothetical protein